MICLTCWNLEPNTTVLPVTKGSMPYCESELSDSQWSIDCVSWRVINSLITNCVIVMGRYGRTSESWGFIYHSTIVCISLDILTSTVACIVRLFDEIIIIVYLLNYYYFKYVFKSYINPFTRGNTCQIHHHACSTKETCLQQFLASKLPENIEDMSSVSKELTVSIK